MLAWAWARGFRPTRANWISGAVVGALFFLVGHGTLHWAEQYVGSGLAALLIATEPMFILVLGWLFGQQKISGISALGLGLGAIGVALLTGAELTTKGSSLLGIIAVLVGSLSWAAGVVMSPKLKLPTDALGRTALATICGAAMLLVAACATGEFQATHWASISVKSIFGLGYLITFGSIIAFTSYTWLLQRCPPTLVATHTYANPVVAVFLGWLLASEPLTMRVVLASGGDSGRDPADQKRRASGDGRCFDGACKACSSPRLAGMCVRHDFSVRVRGTHPSKITKVGTIRRLNSSIFLNSFQDTVVST